MKNTPSPLQAGLNIEKKTRNSNLELFRIICMMMIVAHHYVVCSGLDVVDCTIMAGRVSLKSLFISIFGAWGKTGINCFLMITGYYMCTSKINLRKFVKLLAQVYLYRWLLYLILLFTGYESFSAVRLVKLLMPFWGFSDGFTSCFIAFYLTIPFLTILVQNMTKRQHELLLLLSIGIYSLLGSIPTFHVTFNYITWFGVIFFISSYIRMYPQPLFENKKLWGWLSIIFITLAIISIVGIKVLYPLRRGAEYLFVSDSNKIFAVAIAVCTFLWFKNMKIYYNKRINAFGAATFGVLLLHSNSNAMRTWLWKDAVDVVGHYSMPTGEFMLFSIGIVLAIFTICNLIDQLRIATLEKWFFNWYDRKISLKAESLVKKITQ